MFQIVIDSLVFGSELALLAIGLTMVYGSLRFANFAHVEFATIGAYLALAFLPLLVNQTMAEPGTGKVIYLINSFGPLLGLGCSFLLAVLLAGGLGILCDILIFRRLRNSTPILLMIASFGLGIILRESVRAIHGTEPCFYPLGLQRPIDIMGGHITPIQIFIVLITVLCTLLFHFLLNRTRLGIAMRATADNPQLAKASAIHTERVVQTVWLIGCGFAALGGILLGLETQIHPRMGFGIIIPVFCAAILGGIGNPYGAVLGAGIVAFTENIGLSINWAILGQFLGLTDKTYLAVPTGYKEAIPFLIMIIVLLFRPQGIIRDANK